LLKCLAHEQVFERLALGSHTLEPGAVGEHSLDHGAYSGVPLDLHHERISDLASHLRYRRQGLPQLVARILEELAAEKERESVAG